MKKTKIYLCVNYQCNEDWKSDPIIETFGTFEEADNAFTEALRDLYRNWCEEYGEENIKSFDADNCGKYVVNYISHDEEDNSLPTFEIFDIRDSVRKFQKIYITEREVVIPSTEKAVKAEKEAPKKEPKKTQKATSKKKSAETEKSKKK